MNESKTPERAPVQNRSAFFDWIVFIISFSLGFIFPSLGSFVTSPQFTWWMLAALVCYTAGSWLKHLPLSYRLTTSPGRRREIAYTIFLIAGHWCIMLLVIIFAETAFGKILGVRSFMDKKADNPAFMFGSMFLSGFLTWLVYRSKKLGRKVKVPGSVFLFRRELVADILLITGVSILTFVMWEKGIIALLSHKAVTSFSEVWFLFLMLSITYLLFYLPLRYLFLIEDHSNRQTWKRMLLIFAFLLLRSFFEIIRIG